MSSGQNINNDIKHITKALKIIFIFEMRCQKLREELEFFYHYEHRCKHAGACIRLNHEVMYLCVDTYSLHKGISQKKSLYSNIIKNKGAFFSKIDKREHTNPENFIYLGTISDEGRIEATQEEVTHLIRQVNKQSIQARKTLQQTKGIKSSSHDDLDQWISSIQDEQTISDLAEYRRDFAHRLDSLNSLSKELECPGHTEFIKRFLVVSDVLGKYKEALQTILRYNQSTRYLDSIKGIQYNSISELQRDIKLRGEFSAKTKTCKAFRELGEQTVHLKGKLEGEQSLVLRQLTRRIGDVAPELQSQIQSLTLNQLEALGEALLDFTESNDLVSWLEKNPSQQQ